MSARERTVRASPKSDEAHTVPRLGLWVGGVAGALTLLLVHAGWSTGDWHGVIVSEVQILVVAAISYLGLRPSS